MTPEQAIETLRYKKLMVESEYDEVASVIADLRRQLAEKEAEVAELQGRVKRQAETIKTARDGWKSPLEVSWMQDEIKKQYEYGQRQFARAESAEAANRQMRQALNECRQAINTLIDTGSMSSYDKTPKELSDMCFKVLFDASTPPAPSAPKPGGLLWEDKGEHSIWKTSGSEFAQFGCLENSVGPAGFETPRCFGKTQAPWECVGLRRARAKAATALGSNGGGECQDCKGKGYLITPGVAGMSGDKEDCLTCEGRGVIDG